MLVISDATPLNILLRAGLVDVLPALFGRVVIPPAVARELTHPSSPESVRGAVEEAPAWLEVRAPSVPVAEGPKGQGEREAIALAVELHADLFLADDKAARAEAMGLGVPTTGTLGVLEMAAERGLVDLSRGLEGVQKAGLFLSAKLIEHAMRRDTERKRGPGGGDVAS